MNYVAAFFGLVNLALVVTFVLSVALKGGAALARYNRKRKGGGH